MERAQNEATSVNTTNNPAEETVRERLQKVIRDIHVACERAGRSPDEVTLVAVSKTKPSSMIQEAFEAGQIHFGENRVKELETKMQEITEPGICWHFLGYLQKNKIKYMAGGVHWIDSVQKVSAREEANKRAGAAGRTIRVLIQVNISGEDQKSGCDPADLPGILKAGNEMEHLQISGLMGMASLTDDREQIRREFAMLRSLRDEHTELCKPPHALHHLSMGMSGDFDIAIEEGATMIRIGSSIFGSRS